MSVLGVIGRDIAELRNIRHMALQDAALFLYDELRDSQRFSRLKLKGNMRRCCESYWITEHPGFFSWSHWVVYLFVSLEDRVFPNPHPRGPIRFSSGLGGHWHLKTSEGIAYLSSSHQNGQVFHLSMETSRRIEAQYPSLKFFVNPS